MDNDFSVTSAEVNFLRGRWYGRMDIVQLLQVSVGARYIVEHWGQLPIAYKESSMLQSPALL